MDWKRKNLPQVENCIHHRNETPDSENISEETQKERSVVPDWKPFWGGQGNAHAARCPLSSPRHRPVPHRTWSTAPGALGVPVSPDSTGGPQKVSRWRPHPEISESYNGER